jgi:hypothetical protein
VLGLFGLWGLLEMDLMNLAICDSHEILGDRSGILWFKEMYLGVKLKRDRLEIVDMQLDWIEKHFKIS